MQAHDTYRVKQDDRCYIVECVQCGQTFEATRSDASFCKPSCRVAYSREPARSASALRELEQMASRVHEIGRKYKHSPEMYAAVDKLSKQVLGALGWFEVD